jgi:hypothetical protein
MRHITSGQGVASHPEGVYAAIGRLQRGNPRDQRQSQSIGIF